VKRAVLPDARRHLAAPRAHGRSAGGYTVGLRDERPSLGKIVDELIQLDAVLGLERLFLPLFKLGQIEPSRGVRFLQHGERSATVGVADADATGRMVLGHAASVPECLRSGCGKAGESHTVY